MPEIIAGPEQLATDLLNRVGSDTEAQRAQHLLHSDSQPSPYGSQPFSAYNQVVPSEYGRGDNAVLPKEHNVVPLDGQSNGGLLSLELDSEFANLHGGSLRHRKAAAQDLEEAVAKVNSGNLAPGLTLEPLTDASHLKFTNQLGLPGHKSLSLDLASGTISDESNQQYVVKTEGGRLDFVAKGALHLDTPSKVSLDFDEKDQIKSVKLPDKTGLRRETDNIFTILDAEGNPTGMATTVVTKENFVGYLEVGTKSAPVFVLHQNGATYEHDLETGRVYRTDKEPGTRIILSGQEFYLAAQLLQIAETDAHLPQQSFNQDRMFGKPDSQNVHVI